jgi:hypothetical protein
MTPQLPPSPKPQHWDAPEAHRAYMLSQLAGLSASLAVQAPHMLDFSRPYGLRLEVTDALTGGVR